MRNGRPERHRGNAGLNARVLKHPGDAGRALIARLLQPERLRRIRRIGRPGDRHRSSVRRVGQQGAEDHDGLHVQLVGDGQQLGTERAPPHVGLHTVHQHDVAVAARRSAVRDPHRRPHQLARHSVDLTDHRPVDLVVVVGLIVDLHDLLGLPYRVQVLERVAGGVSGIVPALERCDDDRVAQVGQIGSHRTAEIRGCHPASVSPAWSG